MVDKLISCGVVLAPEEGWHIAPQSKSRGGFPFHEWHPRSSKNCNKRPDVTCGMQIDDFERSSKWLCDACAKRNGISW